MPYLQADSRIHDARFNALEPRSLPRDREGASTEQQEGVFRAGLCRKDAFSAKRGNSAARQLQKEKRAESLREEISDLLPKGWN